MLGGVKLRKIRKNEKKLEKMHGSIILHCTNEICHNKAKVTEEEAKRVFQCSKCSNGFLKKMPKEKNKK